MSEPPKKPSEPPEKPPPKRSRDWIKGTRLFRGGDNGGWNPVIAFIVGIIVGIIVAVVVGRVIASNNYDCADWQDEYRTILSDFGEIGSDDWDDYPDIDPKDSHRLRREVVVQSLVGLGDKRPVGCRAP